MSKLRRSAARRCADNSIISRHRRLFAVGLATAGSVAAMGVLPATARADTFAQAFKNQVIDQAQITGHARIYDFRRWHDANAPYPVPQSSQAEQSQKFDKIGDAIGGDITLETGSLYGFSLGTALYIEHRLVKYDDAKANVGLNDDLNQISEGYIQYQNYGVRVRAGRQLIDTPFANTDMFTMLPRSFYGVSGTVSLFNNFMTHSGPQELKNSDYQISEFMPFSYEDMSATPDAKLYVGRFTRSVNRFSDEWSSVNTEGYPVGRQPGIFTAGLQYQQQMPVGGLLGEAWYYNFFNIGKMGYAEAGYELPALMDGGPRPFVRAQYLHETESGSAALGDIDATIYGGKIGVEGRNWEVSLLAEHSPAHEGAWGNGRFAHPYTDLSGVLYDDTMNSGIENSGPGTSYGIDLSGSPTENLSVFTRYVWHKADYGVSGDYYSFGTDGFPAGTYDDPNGVHKRDQGGYGWDTGFTYSLAGLNPNLDGLTIGDNVGVVGWDGAHTFIDNRIRLIYSF